MPALSDDGSGREILGCLLSQRHNEALLRFIC